MAQFKVLDVLCYTDDITKEEKERAELMGIPLEREYAWVPSPVNIKTVELITYSEEEDISILETISGMAIQVRGHWSEFLDKREYESR